MLHAPAPFRRDQRRPCSRSPRRCTPGCSPARRPCYAAIAAQPGARRACSPPRCAGSPARPARSAAGSCGPARRSDRLVDRVNAGDDHHRPAARAARRAGGHRGHRRRACAPVARSSSRSSSRRPRPKGPFRRSSRPTARRRPLTIAALTPRPSRTCRPGRASPSPAPGSRSRRTGAAGTGERADSAEAALFRARHGAARRRRCRRRRPTRRPRRRWTCRRCATPWSAAARPGDDRARPRLASLITLGARAHLEPARPDPRRSWPRRASRSRCTRRCATCPRTTSCPASTRSPDDSVGLLQTNHAFIEAYMVGLNHEMARQLLWAGYPTDCMGSYFRQFWDVSGYVPPARRPGRPRPARRAAQGHPADQHLAAGRAARHAREPRRDRRRTTSCC